VKKEIFINSTSSETRIAITEDGKLAEYFVETPDLSRNIGDIYLGKVARVLHGIRAAFIHLGYPQDAFLHFSDIDTSVADYSRIVGDDEDVDEEDDEEGDDEEPVKETSVESLVKFSRNAQTNFIDIKPGQDILVQVTKEPVGKKGFRVTTKVSIPGRYLVLLPFHRRIALSKKIYNFREKKRLRYIVRSVLPKEYGVIIRTVAAGQDESLILDDLNNILQEWKDIQNKIKNVKAPYILYKDATTTSSVIRDLFRDEISRIFIDSKRLFRTVKKQLETSSPEFLEKIELFEKKIPIFDTYDIERQIEESLQKKVMIKNYGYLVIETTEAMTVIDVNSGKYAKAKEQEINSLKINIEAAKEIVRQLRLRDIGGIIVVDFIDLYDDLNKKRLYDELRKEFRKDRAKVTVLPMSDFGVVQITRQRIRQNIIQRITDLCPMCSGTGRIQSTRSFIPEIERWIKRYKQEKGSKRLKLTVNPFTKTYLKSGFISKIFRLSLKNFLYIKLAADEKLALNDFKFSELKTDIDITEDFE